jgi:hypothetical protein
MAQTRSITSAPQPQLSNPEAEQQCTGSLWCKNIRQHIAAAAQPEQCAAGQMTLSACRRRVSMLCTQSKALTHPPACTQNFNHAEGTSLLTPHNRHFAASMNVCKQLDCFLGN